MFDGGVSFVNYLESLITHIRKKVKGIVYTHRDLANLIKKEMKKNGHDSKYICKKYGIDTEEFKAMVSGRYYFNGHWYKIVSDYTGMSIKELTEIRNTIFFKRWKRRCNM